MNSQWHLGYVPQQPHTYRGNDIRAVRQWWEMTLPGGIHTALMQNNVVPDLYKYENLPRAKWVDEQDWWLKQEVTLTRTDSERCFVRFDCVDYMASVWLDDTFLGHHEGAFSAWELELTDYVPPDGNPHTFRLALRLTGFNAFPQPSWTRPERVLIQPTRLIHRGKAGISPYHPRLRLLRPPMQAGWDFAPTLPILGVWERPLLETTGNVRIVHLDIGKWRFNPETHKATTTCTLMLDTLEPTITPVTLAWAPMNFEDTDGLATYTLTVPKGMSKHQLHLTIPDAHRWHPWEQGAPNLYRLTVSVPHSHSTTTRFGIRTATWNRYRMTVNEQPFFARGVNWVPLDLLGATSEGDHERYHTLLTYAREQNVNFIRVWGGGGRERRIFYELCDELGLLIWQEMPFACAFLDHYPRDEEFLSLAEREARGIVRALEPHPSIAVWCAGNEFSLQRNRPLVSRLAAMVQREDDRPFLPPSPSGTDHHQWQVWHGYAPLHHLDEQTALFLSEVGLQALPNQSTLNKILATDKHFPPNPAWEEIHGEIAKLRAYLPADAHHTLENFIAASQEAQARGVQLAIENLRRRKAQGTGGITLWQWNEPYPAISWALVDFFGESKTAAHQLKEWFNPVTLLLEFDRKRAYKPGDTIKTTLWAINDLDEPVHTHSATIRQGRHELFSGVVEMPPHSALPVQSLSLYLLSDDLIELELRQADGERVAHNTYPLILPPPDRAPRFHHLYRMVASWVLER